MAGDLESPDGADEDWNAVMSSIGEDLSCYDLQAVALLYKSEGVKEV